MVLPAKFPNLLVNGSTGIAVGMATNIPPHNLSEVIDATIELIKHPDATLGQLMRKLPGPDFPTGAFIHGAQGIKDAYKTGRGSVQVRARAMIEKAARGDKESIVVTEIPYQVNKAKLIERIAELVNDKKIEGVADLRDESNREGMRIVVELKRGENAQVVLNKLYALTPMQSSFGIIFLAIVENQPRVLPLHDLLRHFVDHRKVVVIRRTQFDLKKAEERAHLLRGLALALANLDLVIKIIRASKDPQEARTRLSAEVSMTRSAPREVHRQLARGRGGQGQPGPAPRRDPGAGHPGHAPPPPDGPRAGEDRRRVQGSPRADREAARDPGLREARPRDHRRRAPADPQAVRRRAADGDRGRGHGHRHRGPHRRRGHGHHRVPRRLHQALSPSLYRAQRRGGKGRIGATTKEEDLVEHLFVASTHAYVLAFTSRGRMHWIKVYDIPQLGPATRGKAIVNLLSLSPNERMVAMAATKDFPEDRFLMFATRNGVVKKTALSAYSNVRSGGIIAINLEEGDSLLSVRITGGDDQIFIGTRQGMGIRFSEKDVRPMGRDTTGVIGVSLKKNNDEVVEMDIVDEKAHLLSVTENGYGKRSEVTEYRYQGRGGSGVINVKVTEKNGPVVGIKSVTDADQLLLITERGQLIRIKVNGIRETGRAAQGVRVIQLEEGDRLVGIAKLAESDDAEDEPQAVLPGADKPGPAPAGGKAGKKGETDFLGDDEDDE